MTRQELKFYIEADLIMNGHDRRDKGFYSRLKTLFNPDIILLYLKTLRMVEFYESNANIINKFKGKYWSYRLRKLGYKTGFSISTGVLGYGVVIPHYGTIVVGSGNTIGNYAVLHTSTCITAGRKKIGNAFYCSTGAKVLNDIELYDAVTVGANAVVNKSVEESNVLLVGIPAKIKQKEEYWYLKAGEKFTARVEKCEKLRLSMNL